MKTDPKTGLLLRLGLAAAISGAAMGLEAQQSGDMLIAGGTVVVHGEAARALDILLSEMDGHLIVEEMGEPGRFQAVDTIDVSGLYLHTANAFSPRQPFQVGGHAMYVVRTGPTQGHPARMLISSLEGQSLEMSANFPAGPVHEAVGCYAVERGPWNPPVSQPFQERFSVPEAVRLHWQFLLHIGREQELAATDGDGRVPANAVLFGWAPGEGDSIQVQLMDGYVGVSFRLLRDGNGYTGTVAHWVHAGDASSWPKAPVRLMPTVCTTRSG